MGAYGYMWVYVVHIYMLLCNCMYIYIPIYNTQLKRIHVYRFICIYTGYVCVETETFAWIYSDVFETWLHMA